LVKKVSSVAAAQYFCFMIKQLPFLLLALVFACTNPSKDKEPGTSGQTEIPEHVTDLLGQTSRYPDSVALRLRLVDALDSLGDYTQAISQMDSLILRDSLNYAFWYRKALVQQNDEDTTGALRSYRYAIAIYPAPDAILGAANLFAEKKDPTALTLAGNIADMRLGDLYDAHSFFITGVYFARKGEKKKAIEAFDACIYNNHNYIEAYMEKGFLLYDAKETDKAITVFETATKTNPMYADGYYWLAKCQEAQHKTTEAVANYKLALQLDPGMKEAAAAAERLKN
jgi:tetratricopeptide (TPR) repeat protein